MKIIRQSSKDCCQRAFCRCLAAVAAPPPRASVRGPPISSRCCKTPALASALRIRPPPLVIPFAPPVASLSFVLLPPQFSGSGDGEAPVLRRLVPATAASSPTFHASPNCEATPSSSAHPGHHGPGKATRTFTLCVCVTCPGNRELTGLLSTFILYNTTPGDGTVSASCQHGDNRKPIARRPGGGRLH